MSMGEISSNKGNEYLSRLEVDGEDGNEYIDHWETGELLFLASSVQRSDRNWVSVARGLKIYGENSRPADFYTPKNCALQYSRLLNEIDEDSKKKTLPRTERETSEAMLVKNLTDKRMTELSWLNQQTKSAASVLKTYVDMVESGEFDDQLDDILKNIEEIDKKEEDKYLEYISKRESLNSAKKLNKSRVSKGKGSKALESRKKNLSYSDLAEDSPSKATVAEVVKNIKKEIEDEIAADSAKQHVKKKSELDTNISLNALLDSKVTMPSSVSPTSPLLTSLLRTITSSSSVSPSLPPLSSSPLKELDHTEGDHIGMLSKSTSPRGSVPQSPRPTPSSSPLLNSLLKNSPSSSTIASKDFIFKISPKSVSSPQPFFNPSSALSSSAAQQLAAATSTQSLSHQFFPQEASDSRKQSFQTSPVTSACLSAPTLSKLLEMPPSTPGRLPPLPVLDPPTPPTPVSISPMKTSIQQLQSELKLNLSECSPLRKTPERSPAITPPKPAFHIPISPSSIKRERTPSESEAISKIAASLEKHEAIIPGISQIPNIPIKLEPEELKNVKLEVTQEEIVALSQDNSGQEFAEFFIEDIKDIVQPKFESISKNDAEINVKMEKDETFPLEKMNFEDYSNVSIKKEILSPTKPAKTPEKVENKQVEIKSIKPESPVRELPDIKPKEEPTQTLLSAESIKTEIESPAKGNVQAKKASTEIPVSNKLEESEDKEPVESETELKSPVAKKPKIYDSPEKQGMSEDELPVISRRSGRKSKRMRGRGAKQIQQEQPEPKDHYEFTESADESSAGFLSSNMLRYGSRIKDASRPDDKTKTPTKGETEDKTTLLSTDSLASEKNLSPMKNKSGAPLQTYSRGKISFAAEEEIVSDSFLSDETSNSLLTEDKLKKWEESVETQNDEVSESNKTSQKNCGGDLSKRKKGVKRPLPFKNPTASKKERKSTSSDFDELSTCSKDSEDAVLTSKQDKESPNKKTCIKVESKSDSIESQVITAGTTEAMEDSESLQGSISTELSPLLPSDTKEEKEPPQTGGKQEWFQGVSPKSSEHVSQSSEESEYESDNWDNHSVSTNKSASHSSDQPKTKRKERESAHHKAWKKAIHIVLREASCHKYANVFLQKVTDDVAPGYSGIVYRPMDLSQIKKNIDNGVIKTTEEFHRDMLLMFQNAIMYNSSDHDVYKMAMEMQLDVMQQILAFLTTQYNDQDENLEPPSLLRGVRATKAQKGAGKQFSSGSKHKEDTDRDSKT